jgi:GH25 family lysozyme M1 (1,4-beta-N-acetylmuramidase)
MQIEFAIQKNRRNGEKRTYVRDRENPTLCIVEATINLVDRAAQLGQDADKPVCIYQGNGNKMRYITADAVNKYLRKIAKYVYPHMEKEELSLFSCHSYRVWAAVLIDESGKGPDYLMNRLRWLSECYRRYLRDTVKAAEQHNTALRNDANDINFALTRNDLENNETYETTPEDNEMGEYVDFE